MVKRSSNCQAAVHWLIGQTYVISQMDNNC